MGQSGTFCEPFSDKRYHVLEIGIIFSIFERANIKNAM